MRKVTSAIEGMSVAEVRRGLDTIRTKWNQQPARFYFTDRIFNDMTVQQFCTEFTLGHHTKRHAKSKRGSGESAHKSAQEASPENHCARKDTKKKRKR